MNPARIQHRPSGRMCAACAHQLADCSALPFGTMPRLRRDADGAVVVRCSHFDRRPSDMQAAAARGVAPP